MPSRRQLLTELAVRQAQLESLKNTILRLNRTIQLDRQQFAVWEDEASAGLDRVKGRVWDMPTQLAFDSFIDGKEAYYEDLEEEGKLTAFDKDQMRKLAMAKELKSFTDFKDSAMEDKSDWETFEGGIRQLIDALPLDPVSKAYVDGAKDLIDNAYDVTDLLVTQDNVQQLDHNSTQCLDAVRKNGERMKMVVAQIQQIEAQLNKTAEQPPSSSSCSVKLAATAR